MILLSLLQSPWPESWDFSFTRLVPYMMWFLEPLVPVLAQAVAVLMAAAAFGAFLRWLRG
jgi:hypothetical protein